MTKEQFQKELLENVTEGVKPSDLKKKLKRSKSADDIANNKPPTPLLQEQLKVKQSEIENLRKKLEDTNTKLTKTTQELDNSLFARVAAVKQFGKIHDQLQKIKQELNENVEQASEELISADDKASNLRTKLFTASQQISSLQKDLSLASRLAELRKHPLPDDNPNWDYLKPLLYALGAITLTIWLLRNYEK